MKQLIERIVTYNPVNDQERIDKQLILTYIDMFADVLTRNNKICHFTSSGFILNETCSKVLMVHHNIFNSYSWVGGHLDGDPDCLGVAHQEGLQETGLSSLKMLSPNIMSIDILPVIGHYKNSEYVAPHLHMSIAHLFMASEKSQTRAKLDENSAVKWLPIHDLETHIAEPHLLVIYDKIKEKVRLLQEAPF